MKIQMFFYTKNYLMLLCEQSSANDWAVVVLDVFIVILNNGSDNSFRYRYTQTSLILLLLK
jgi:hypothetical protein